MDMDEYHPKATRTLFVGNLEKDTAVQDLTDKFSDFGEIIVSKTVIWIVEIFKIFKIFFLYFHLFHCILRTWYNLGFFWFLLGIVGFYFTIMLLYSLYCGWFLISVSFGHEIIVTVKFQNISDGVGWGDNLDKYDEQENITVLNVLIWFSSVMMKVMSNESMYIPNFNFIKCHFYWCKVFWYEMELTVRGESTPRT